MEDIKKIEEVIYKYFKGGNIQYFHVSDYHNDVENNFYIRQSFEKRKQCIWIGSDNGEILVLATDYEFEKIDKLLSVYFK